MMLTALKTQLTTLKNDNILQRQKPQIKEEIYKLSNSKHNIRICTLNRNHRSNFNFFNPIDYWFWFKYLTNISWFCLYSIIR